MEEIQAMLAQFTALDASLYVLVLPMSVLLRFCRSYWYGFGDRATLLAGFVLGAGGSILAAVDAGAPRPLLWIAAQAVSLVVAVLVGEIGARKLPWLPKDDHLALAKEMVAPPSENK